LERINEWVEEEEVKGEKKILFCFRVKIEEDER
jgi:hypothetical protein